jgi:hypothetical protein
MSGGARSPPSALPNIDLARAPGNRPTSVGGAVRSGLRRAMPYDGHMTLGEYLIRRDRKVLIPGGLLVLGTGIVGSGAPKGSLWAILEPAVFPLFVAVHALFSHRARCPRCQVRLGYIDLSGGKGRRVPLPGMDGCSNCGLHRHEVIPTAP